MQRQARAIAVGSARCAAAVALAWMVVTKAERARAAHAARRQHDTMVAHERVVQDLVAAKWAIEAGHSERGLEIVTNALNQAQDVVWQMRQKKQTGPGRRS